MADKNKKTFFAKDSDTTQIIKQVFYRIFMTLFNKASILRKQTKMFSKHLVYSDKKKYSLYFCGRQKRLIKLENLICGRTAGKKTCNP